MHLVVFVIVGHKRVEWTLLVQFLEVREGQSRVLVHAMKFPYIHAVDAGPWGFVQTFEIAVNHAREDNIIFAE